MSAEHASEIKQTTQKPGASHIDILQMRLDPTAFKLNQSKPSEVITADPEYDTLYEQMFADAFRTFV